MKKENSLYIDAKLASDITTGALANGTTKIGFIRKLIKEKNEVEQLKKELLALQEKFRQREEKAENVGGGFTELQSAKFDLLCYDMASAILYLDKSIGDHTMVNSARKDNRKKLLDSVSKLEKK
jgi:hypothetical protein